MLKKIETTDLRLGMHLHGLDGPWLAHPFWRAKFVLADEADVRSLRTSAVSHCWIDVAKGLDVPLRSTRPAALDAAPVERAPSPMPREEPDGVPPPPSADFDDELARASRLCRRSKVAVQQMFGEVRMGKALHPEAFEPLVAELVDSVFRNPGALVSLARLKTKDDYSYMHSVAVCALMVALARELGFDMHACREAGMAGLLHDVGKAAMPLEVLNKPGKLTEAEFALIRAHPSRGHALLAEGGSASEAALDVCLHHHERLDGAGYPLGLQGDAISRLAGMGAVCDIYDAVSSARPYKPAWDPAEALSRMASWKGHFDATLFEVFVRSLGIYPTGALVRLRSQRLAVVIKQHAQDLTTPTVKAFYSIRSGMPIEVVSIDLSRRDGHDAIVAREPPGQWKFPHLDALWAGDAATR